MKPAVRKDMLFGGTAGALVCVTFVLSVTTMGPLLGIEWPGFGAGGPGPEEVSIPAAEVRVPLAEARPSERRPVADRRAASAKDRRDTGTSSSDAVRRRAPRRTDVPATTLPPAAPPAPAGPAAPAAVSEPAPAAAPAAAARTRAMTLRVASVAVTTATSDDAPELRVGLAITDPKPGLTVPQTLTLRLRPDLPAEPQPAGAALALHAAIDVVDAAPGGAQPLQVRVRMGLAAADTAAATVADRGDGDGQSNILDVNVPLSALAPPEEEDDGAQPEGPAQSPTAEAPASSVPSLETEVRLDLVPEATSGDGSGAITEVPVPTDVTGPEPAHESVPVTVLVDGTAPAEEPAPAPAPTTPAQPAEPEYEPAPEPQPAPEPAAAGSEPAAVASPEDHEHEHRHRHEGDHARVPELSR